MAVSERDRAYMRAIGVYKADVHAEALKEHLSLPLAERLRRSRALYERQRGSLPSAAERDDDPTAFYALARRLGLYRG